MFVLGAGASKPYGFPTGEELLDSVLRGMSLEPGWRSHLAKLEFDQKQVDAFRRDFLESGQPSVDLFVEHRPEYERLGKAAIALGLIPRENHSWVFPPPDTDAPHDHNDNWYQYIFEKMNAPFDQFGENQVSFVTFNYDRSLEHFFRTAVRRSYGKSLAEADARSSRKSLLSTFTAVSARSIRPVGSSAPNCLRSMLGSRWTASRS